MRNIHSETGEEMTVVNSLNAKWRVKHTRPTSNISKTIPDQSIPIRTLLDRHSRGFEVEGLGQPLYNPTGIGKNVKSLDLIDLADMQERTTQKIIDLRNQAEDEAKTAREKRAAAKEKADEEAAERVAAKLAAKKGTVNP